MEFSIGPSGSDNLLQPRGIREISNCCLWPPAPQFGFEAADNRDNHSTAQKMKVEKTETN